MHANGEVPDPLVATSVGKYRVAWVLGRGGMGSVYLAEDPDGRAVALKMVRRDLARDTVFRARFEREARIATQVTNPHLVPVLDYGEHDDVPFLIQRFMGGGNLEERLSRDGPLSIDAALRVTAEIAGGLVALAEHDLVHRDVKPANILLDGDGSAYLTDFGLARDLKGTALTRLEHAIGSPQYMSPEQIRGHAVTQASDVYALGCVLFECLTGAPPFAHVQGIRVMFAQLNEAPADPCAAIDDAPAGLGDAVRTALAKDPAARPVSAGAYVDALLTAAPEAAAARVVLAQRSGPLT
jgi:serine/threonine protein kinase